MSENKDEFKYNYSAPTENERREIESIRRQYSDKSDDENKFERMRLLDRRVKGIPKIISIFIGILGTLIFGLGLSLVMSYGIIYIGIVVSVIGAICLLFTYPIFKIILNKTKQKWGGEILRLSEELLHKGETK